MECIFCRIATGSVPANIVFEDDDVVAFRDLDPKAPVHVLVIPRKHIASVNDMEEAERGVLGGLFLAARQVATAEGIAGTGYRLVMNTGHDAGQAVLHAHLHVMGGRTMSWPPG